MLTAAYICCSSDHSLGSSFLSHWNIFFHSIKISEPLYHHGPWNGFVTVSTVSKHDCSRKLLLMQQCRSLEILMRETFGSESGLHNHGKHQLGHPSIADSDRLPSPTSYQQTQIGAKQLSMPMPRVPLPSGHMTVTSEISIMSDIDGHPSLAIPSPISPRTTRCPSLAESIFTSATCSSPSGDGPTTPTSEHGGTTHGFNTRRDSHGVGRVFDGRINQYQSKGHSPALSNRHPHNDSNPTTSLQVGMPTNRLLHSMDPDTPMMPEHEERITKQEKRRRNHLNSEKRRRENIKGGMDALVDLVPSCRNIQESKANILKKTREYIFQILNGYKDAQLEVKRLSQENKELRRLLSLQSPVQHQGQPESLVYRARS